MALHKVLNRHGQVLAPGPALAQFPVEVPLATQPLCQRLPKHKGLVKSLLIFHLSWRDGRTKENKIVPSSPKLLPVFCFLVPASAV